VLGGIFERSPWVAQRATAARPFATAAALHHAMVDAVARAPHEAQLALLRAHPDLAGKEAQAGALTQASQEEQKSAALDRLSRQEMEWIDRANAQYKTRFGFPFIICVRNHDKRGILQAFAQRLDNAPEIEFATALNEVYQIARLRLEALLEAR
jgi:2-oxo-4-hydroxy-4-carboxy-5-ureidoimidazoline decarboxylase